ncbi:MAG: metallophosphoesterase, partial [Deltaproteobacteria bacterium]
NRYARWGIVALFLLAIAVPAWAQTPSRIVAIGDVHGAYSEFASILQRTKLVDGNLNWSGNDVTLVQLGDILDRGADSRKALDLMMKLEGQAAQTNCKIIPLLGNHEVMDMVGDVRYVSAGEYQAFADAQSEARRASEFESYTKFMKQHAPPGSPFSTVDRDKWMAEHPLGFFELRDAYGPKGRYGKWFRTHDVAAEVGDVIFLHGGLDPDLHYKSVQDINKQAHRELNDFDSLWKTLTDEGAVWPYLTLEESFKLLQVEYQASQSGLQTWNPYVLQNIVRYLRDFPKWSIMNPDGPLWYRDLAVKPEDPAFKTKIDAMLKNLKAAHIIMGHTVMTRDFSITPRFSGDVFLIDTGMLSFYFHGRPSALEIQGGRFTAVYASGDQVVLLNPKVGQASPAMVQHAEGNSQR